MSRIYSITIKAMDGYDISSSGFISPYYSIEDSLFACFHIIVSGGASPDGYFTCRGSAEDQLPANFALDIANNITITDNSIVMINFEGVAYKWLQLQYTRTSGTGQCTVWFNKKIEGT